MASSRRKKLAVAFVTSIAKGAFAEGIFAPDFFAWTAISHRLSGDTFRQRTTLIDKIFPRGLQFTFDRLTEEDGRVVLQVRGEGTLFNGVGYNQSYHILVEFDDQDRVRHFREYMDTKLVHDVLLPAMEQWAHAQGG